MKEFALRDLIVALGAIAISLSLSMSCGLAQETPSDQSPDGLGETPDESSFDGMMEWVDRTGKSKFTARLIEQDAKSVTLESGDGRRVQVAKSKLDVTLAKRCHLKWLRDEDRRQLELLSPHIERMTETPQTIVQLFADIHKSNESAPYAGLLAGTLVSISENDTKKAKNLLVQAISRIERHRVFDKDAHGQTYVAAKNNLAVCLIKERNAVGAARLLEEIMGLPNPPLASYHNATYLNEFANAFSQLTLSSDRAASLLAAVARSGGRKEATGVKAYFAYSLAMDSASDTKPLTLEKPELGRPPEISEDMVRYSFGSGFCISPGIVMTNRHVVDSDIDPDPAFVVNVGESPPFAKTLVTKVMKPDHADVDLAIVYCEDLNTPALQFSSASPSTGADIRILGFPNPSVYDFQKFMTGGTVNTKAKMGRSVSSIVTDARIGSGNSGGPAIDRSGRVVGVAFAETLLGKLRDEKRGLLVDPVAATDWLAKIGVPFQETGAPNQSDARWEDVYKVASPSIVMIEQYVRKDRLSARSSTQERDANVVDVSQLKMVFDDWCLICSGKGRVSCQAGCTKGRIPYRKVVQVGFNRLTNSPIMGSRTFYNKCGVCSGSGFNRCPKCGGKQHW